MRKAQKYFGTLSLGMVLVFGFSAVVVQADGWFRSKAVKGDKITQEECGSCHMVYLASLLPEKSWQKIMGSLDQHFGKNAEVDDETKQHISRYLIKYSLGNKYGNSKMLCNFLKNKTPVRITELPYFIRKHDEIPERMLKNNPKVSSLS